MYYGRSPTLPSAIPRKTSHSCTNCTVGVFSLTPTQHGIQSPDLADTHLQKLKVTENSSLSIATSCNNCTTKDHLHWETWVLPFQYHVNIRGTHMYQFTDNHAHPLHRLPNEPVRRRRSNQPHTAPFSYYQLVMLTNSLLCTSPPLWDTQSVR